MVGICNKPIVDKARCSRHMALYDHDPVDYGSSRIRYRSGIACVLLRSIGYTTARDLALLLVSTQDASNNWNQDSDHDNMEGLCCMELGIESLCTSELSHLSK